MIIVKQSSDTVLIEKGADHIAIQCKSEGLAKWFAEHLKGALRHAAKDAATTTQPIAEEVQG